MGGKYHTAAIFISVSDTHVSPKWDEASLLPPQLKQPGLNFHDLCLEGPFEEGTKRKKVADLRE